MPVGAADTLTRDLYTYLLNELYTVPAPRRARSCWVMNQEWYDECTKIGGNPREPHGWPEPGCTTLLGLPFMVTEAGGFPHLIAD
jgi:hypothetical protein